MYFCVHGEFDFFLALFALGFVEGIMSRPKSHYRVVVSNLQTRAQFKIELVDLPFVLGRTFRVRASGKWARKMPVGGKTTVLRQLRGWSVSH